MESEIIIKIKNKINIFFGNYFYLLLSVFIIVLLALGSVFIVKPKYESLVEEIKEAGKEKNLEYSERKKYLNKLEELKAEYDGISASDIDKAYLLAPKEEYYEKLFAEMENIILKNGFLLSSLSIEKGESAEGDVSRNISAEDTEESEEKDSEKIRSLSIKMDVLGTDYANLKVLLSILENNLRLLDIVDLSFNPGGNSTSLTMSAYYME